MRIGPLPDAMDPGFQCVRAQWIRGFIAFELARAAWTVRLMVLTCPESVAGAPRLMLTPKLLGLPA
jgi:hypothetical protein